MSQANSEDRDFRLEKSRDCLARVFTGLRVTRTIAQENTIRIHCKYLICRCLSWHHSHSTAVFRSILRILAEYGCRMTVVPAQTSADQVLAMIPDGIFLSNGPGDPEPCEYASQAIARFLETEIPIFGICLGHQLLALASGAKTLKMKFGHHGANHPVQELATGRVLISSQNHGFAVDEATLPPNLVPTYRSLFDGSLQGVARTDRPAFSFQGHPEASPGPHDVAPLFDSFIQAMIRRLQSQLRNIRQQGRKQAAEG